MLAAVGAGQLKIQGGKLITLISQEPYSLTFYKLGTNYFAARNNEFGYANYEIIPYPQYVLNPLAALLNQFSIELGLTEEQRHQILPFLKEEVTQLEALKKNTSLSGLKKVEQLKQIGGTIDAKVSPLLNPEQQKKFQTMRDEARRRLVEKMGSKAMEKAEEKVEQLFQ